MLLKREYLDSIARTMAAGDKKVCVRVCVCVRVTKGLVVIHRCLLCWSELYVCIKPLTKHKSPALAVVSCLCPVRLQALTGQEWYTQQAVRAVNQVCCLVTHRPRFFVSLPALCQCCTVACSAEASSFREFAYPCDTRFEVLSMISSLHPRPS